MIPKKQPSFRKVTLALILVCLLWPGARTNGSQAPASNPLLKLSLGSNVSTCREGPEIPAQELAAIDNAALLFVHAALSADPASAFQSFTAYVQEKMGKDRFVKFMKYQVDPMRPFAQLAVSHSYLADVRGQTGMTQVLCGKLSNPQTVVTVTVKHSGETAWVLINGNARNNTWTFVTSLVPVAGKWRVETFYAGASTLGNQSLSDIRALAQKQAARGNLFNAIILYDSALGLAQRGRDFQLGIVPVIRQELASIQAPSALRGPLPFIWKFGTKQYRILNVGPIFVGGDLDLIIAHQHPPWKNYAEVDRENRDLIKGFASRFPEYSEVFSGVIAEAHEEGGNGGYRTVEVLRHGALVPLEWHDPRRRGARLPP